MYRRAAMLLPCVLMGPPLLSANAAEVSVDCKPVLAAMEKTVRSDHTTLTTRGTETMHGVTFSGTAYLQMNGTWHKSLLTVEENIAQSRENLKNAKAYTCKALPDAVVDGVPALTYATRTVSEEDVVVDSRVAIARATGLAVSVDNRFAGDPARAIVTHYGYANVKAPM